MFLRYLSLCHEQHNIFIQNVHRRLFRKYNLGPEKTQYFFVVTQYHFFVCLHFLVCPHFLVDKAWLIRTRGQKTKDSKGTKDVKGTKFDQGTIDDKGTKDDKKTKEEAAFSSNNGDVFFLFELFLMSFLPSFFIDLSFVRVCLSTCDA